MIYDFFYAYVIKQIIWVLIERRFMMKQFKNLIYILCMIILITNFLNLPFTMLTIILSW
jgi:hypothetical protein